MPWGRVQNKSKQTCQSQAAMHRTSYRHYPHGWTLHTAVDGCAGRAKKRGGMKAMSFKIGRQSILPQPAWAMLPAPPLWPPDSHQRLCLLSLPVPCPGRATDNGFRLSQSHPILPPHPQPMECPQDAAQSTAFCCNGFALASTRPHCRATPCHSDPP